MPGINIHIWRLSETCWACGRPKASVGDSLGSSEGSAIASNEAFTAARSVCTAIDVSTFPCSTDTKGLRCYLGRACEELASCNIGHPKKAGRPKTGCLFTNVATATWLNPY